MCSGRSAVGDMPVMAAEAGLEKVIEADDRRVDIDVEKVFGLLLDLYQNVVNVVVLDCFQSAVCTVHEHVEVHKLDEGVFAVRLGVIFDPGWARYTSSQVPTVVSRSDACRHRQRIGQG